MAHNLCVPPEPVQQSVALKLDSLGLADVLLAASIAFTPAILVATAKIVVIKEVHIM